MTIVSLNHACWLIVDGGGLSEALAAVIQVCIGLPFRVLFADLELN